MSEKVRRVGRWAVFAAVWLAVGLAVGVLGAGSDPTVGTSGIKNFPWVNATSFKFTGELWRGSTNLTGRVLGSWDVGLSAPTLDTGQGANELYPMDQAVRTSDSPTFDELTLSGDLLNGYNVTEALKYPEQPASYIIFTDGSTVYAKNGTTGEIEFSGADAATVIQQAIDALSGSGGKIFIKKANYLLTSGLTLPSSLPPPYEACLIIESDGAIFSVHSSVTTDVIKLICTDKRNYSLLLRGFHIYPASKDPSYYGIRIENILNLYIDHVTLGWEGLKLVNCDIVYLSDLYIVDTSNEGVYLDDCGYVFFSDTFLDNVGGYGGLSGYNGLHLRGASTRVFMNNIVIFGQKGSYGGQEYGVYIEGVSQCYCNNFEIDGFKKAGLHIEKGLQVTLDNFRVYNSDSYGIELVSGRGEISYLTLTNFIIYNCTSRGITLYAKSSHPIHHIAINNGLIYDISGTTPIGIAIGDDGSAGAYAHHITVSYVHIVNVHQPFTEDNNADYNIIKNNNFEGYTANPYINGANSQMKYNQGFVTENSGTATIPNGDTSVVVNHGLAGTPDYVVLGATHAEVADAVWSANSTHITITVPNPVSADRDVSWYAVYEP